MSGFVAFLIRILILAGILGLGWLLTEITGIDAFLPLAFIIDIILFLVLLFNHG